MFAFGMANCAIPAILGSQFQLLKCQICPPISLANTHIRENYLVFFIVQKAFSFLVLSKREFFYSFGKTAVLWKMKEAGDEKGFV